MEAPLVLVNGTGAGKTAPTLFFFFKKIWHPESHVSTHASEVEVGHDTEPFFLFLFFSFFFPALLPVFPPD